MLWPQFRNEMWKLFGKKRTYIGFAMFLLSQNAMLLAFRLTRWQANAERMLAGNGYLAADYMSALTVAVIMLIPQMLLLLPLYVTLVGGDLVAKEAEDGTLRMILARPVSRLRLMSVKWLTGAIFAALLVAVLAGTALLFARMWFPWKGMFVFAPIPGRTVFNVLTAGDGLRLYLFSQVFVTMNAVTMLSLAWVFSCFNVKPAAATILALSVLFLNLVMENLPFLNEYQHWFLPYHFRCWLLIFEQPTPWWRIVESQCVLLGINLTCFVIGATGFQMRDFKT